jgi:hypothetical protein
VHTLAEDKPARNILMHIQGPAIGKAKDEVNRVVGIIIALVGYNFLNVLPAAFKRPFMICISKAVLSVRPVSACTERSRSVGEAKRTKEIRLA